MDCFYDVFKCKLEVQQSNQSKLTKLDNIDKSCKLIAQVLVKKAI